MAGLGGCAGVEQFENLIPTGVTPSITAASCTEIGKYDSLISCNQGSLAVCKSEKTVLSNGGLTDCFSPVQGGEQCVQIQFTPNRPLWIYGNGIAWCKEGPGKYPSDATAFPFHRTRNLIGCSSDVCLCLDPLDISTGITCSLTDPLLPNCNAFQYSPTGNDPCCTPTGCH
ncbi:MAG: hypothetical protein EBX52_09430 [Proteobacteria bacterium]|nr:hypothetical protein [Pseudomonadota bacterium]